MTDSMEERMARTEQRVENIEGVLTRELRALNTVRAVERKLALERHETLVSKVDAFGARAERVEAFMQGLRPRIGMLWGLFGAAASAAVVKFLA